MSKLTWVIAISALMTAAPAMASEVLLFCSDPDASVAITGFTITDDGDNDGIGDTLETMLVELTLRNVGSIDLTGIVGNVTSESAEVCVTQGGVSIPALDVGEEATTLPIVVHVTDVDRTDPFESLSGSFDVLLTADQVQFVCVRSTFALDLDLDVEGGAGPTSLVEGFESGLGIFENMNLDAGIPGNSEAVGQALGFAVALFSNMA